MKTIRKRRGLLSLALVFSLVLSLFRGLIPTASAASITDTLSEVNIFNGDFEMGYLTVNGAVKKQSYTYYMYNTESTGPQEIPAYCVNPTEYGVPQTVAPGESIDYIIDHVMADPKAVGILANGYPHMTLAQLNLDNKYQAFYATKMALWCYLIPSWSIDKLGLNPSLSGSELDIGKRLLAAAKKIYINGTQWTTVPQPVITTTPDKEQAYEVTIDGQKYLQQVFSVHSETWVGNLEVNISFADTSYASTVGARIVNTDNKPIMKVPMTDTSVGAVGSFDGKYKILVPAENADKLTGSLDTRLAATVYKFEILFAVCAETDQYGTLQNYLLDTDPVTDMQVKSSFTPPDPTPPPPDTGLEIIKLEEGTDKPLAGAVFEVVAPDGTNLGSWSTGNSGRVTVPITQIGNYTITETVCPKYHLPPKEPTQHVTTYYGKVSTVTFYNAPYGDLRVEKIDAATGESLAGATVQIRHIETGAAYKATTGTGGAANFTKLKPGAYEIVELTAPTGWQKDPQTYTATVVAGESVTFTLKNSALPGLTIIKYDSQTHETMPGVTFEVFRDTVFLGRFETDALGEIHLVDLKPGTYRVVEVNTGDTGHILAPPQEIELTAAGGVKTLYFFNDTTPGMWLVKVDAADPSKAIPNAVFSIRAIDGSFGPKEYTTGRDGTIDLSELPVGSYEVVEKSCPGYIVDGAQRIIHLEANQTARFVFTNSKEPSLQLIKLDPDGKPLPGVTFRISRIEDGARYLDRVTDQNGEIRVEGLEAGVYSIVETATVEGFILDSTEHHVELFPGRTSTIALSNNRKPDLIIHKSDAVTGEPLEGVTFVVKHADGATVTTVKTDRNGEALVENLDPGVFQIIEQAVPDGYLLDESPQLITLAPNRTGHVYFQNYPTPSIDLLKVNAGGESIPGAVFTVAEKGGRVLGDYTVGADGHLRVYGLKPGYYILTEKSVPAPYILNTTPHEVELEAGKTATLTVENHRKPTLTIYKRDSVVGDLIPGAKFQIWAAVHGSLNGELRDLGVFTTDEHGQIKLEEQDVGWVRIKELEPAPGYSIKEPAGQDVFLHQDTDETATFYNVPLSALVIVKEDSATGEKLGGARFRVRYLGGTSGTGGTVIGEYETSANGTIVLTQLKKGAYVVEEIAPAPGHILDSTPQTVYLSGQDQDVVTVTFGNTSMGALLIKKIDSVTHKPISDVEFMVTTSDGTVVGASNGKFTTDSAGSILISNLAPGESVVVKETAAKPGYLLDDTPQSIKIKAGETVTLEFRNNPKGGIVIRKLDSVTKKPLEGVQFQITYADGSFVPDAGGKLSSNGLCKTDKNGLITLSGITGTLVVTEEKTIPGYTIDEGTRSQTVVVNPDDTQTLTFYNDPVGGLELIKVDEDDRGARIPKVEFEIREMDGGLVGTYTTDKRGRFYAPLPAGDYYAVETRAGEGYKLDETPHYFTVRNGRTTTKTVTNKAYTGLIIHKVDSNTGKGVPNAVFLIYDSRMNPIDQVTTNQSGYAYSDELTLTGKVYLRELEAPGYEVDAALKTAYIKAGETTEITWKNRAVMGQIQVYKYSADYNEVTGAAAGTPLKGAVFEIAKARSGQVVGYITSDARGVAASDPLPLDRYIVREVSSPAYYQRSGEWMDAELEYTGQIVKLTCYNKSARLDVTIKKVGNAQVLVGDAMRYDFGPITNSSNVPLESFYWMDHIPVDAVRATGLITGTYSQRLNYRILYKTNYNDYRVLQDNLLSTQNYSISLAPAALGLMDGEAVTQIRFEFGAVASGFTSRTKPMLTVSTLSTLPGGYQIVNRCEAGGRYQGTWQTASSMWLTRTVKYTPPTLPKTGY